MDESTTSNASEPVFPGQELGMEEEYAAGPGTYMENGIIRASVEGTVERQERTISIRPSARLSTLENGTTLIGCIDNISEPVALVVVDAVPDAKNRFVKSSDYCILHASYVKRGYVKNLRDEYRIGDIIRARVIMKKNGETHISTEDADCGCVKAFCSACRTPLDKKASGLECPACGRRENRRLAEDYRKVDLAAKAAKA